MLPFVICIITIFSAISGFLFGYDTGVVSGAILLLKNVFHMSSIQLEVFVSITMASAAIFSLVGGFLNNRIGRKRTILFSAIVYAVGSIILSLSVYSWMLMIGRCVIGVAIGISSTTTPIYIAECVPPQIRGRIVTIYNSSITFGQFISAIFCGVFSYDLQNGWRFMMGLAVIPASMQILLFCLPRMPESPRYLLANNRNNEARDVLRKTALEDITEAELDETVNNIITSCLIDDTSTVNVCQRTFNTPHVRRALFIGCMLQVFQQLIGINTVLYYSATIIQMSGIDNVVHAIWYAVPITGANFIFTFIGIFLVDKMGRRILLLASLIGVFFSLLLLAFGFQLSYINNPVVTNHYGDDMCSNYTHCASCLNSGRCAFCYQYKEHEYSNSSCQPNNSGQCMNGLSYHWVDSFCPSNYAFISIIGLILYLFFFAPGMGPIPWTINSEIYPSWARSFCNSVSTFSNWTSNLLISLTFISLTEVISVQGAFYLYAMLTVLAFIFVLLLVPETKNRSLENMDELFAGSHLIPFRKNDYYSTIST